MEHKTQIIKLIIITGIVGFYQLPLVETALAKNQINIPLNNTIPEPKKLQQNIENIKIALSAEMEKTENIKKNVPLVVFNKPTAIFNKPTAIDENNSKSPINKCTENCIVLLIGDSVMGDVHFSLRRIFKKERPTWRVVDAHKPSTGLSNQVFYNWLDTTENLVTKHRPDYAFILIGTNDAQGLSINGKSFAFNKEAWREEYKNRAAFIAQTMQENKVNWGWVEIPMVKSSNFNQRLQVIRDLQAEVAKEHIIDTKKILGADAHTHLKYRASDGTHLSALGADKLAQYILQEISSD